MKTARLLIAAATLMFLGSLWGSAPALAYDDGGFGNYSGPTAVAGFNDPTTPSTTAVATEQEMDPAALNAIVPSAGDEQDPASAPAASPETSSKVSP
jgi:hypothetical protein